MGKAVSHRSTPAGTRGGGLSNQVASGRRKAPKGESHEPENATSIFDPTLCELLVRWFSPPGGSILDPFAGGSVRGIVSAKLGRRYLGIELRDIQVQANREQSRKIIGEIAAAPEWQTGDAASALDSVPGVFDFILSCPPYADLERYSEDPRDLSTMSWHDFLIAYRAIIEKTVARLKNDRFACFVVSEVRGRDGLCYGLPWRTIEAFEAAGARLYNEAVMVTMAGSLPIRARQAFEGSRKLGRSHQNVLIFCKGSPEAATKAIGSVDFGLASEDPMQDGGDDQ